MSYIDIKYLNLISYQLPIFKKKGDALWNFRCPYCGDSHKSRTKARGFVYRKKNDLFFKCHNCGVGATLGNLIKYVNSKVYDDYILERYRRGVKTNNPEPEFNFDVPVFTKGNILKNLKSLSDLPKTHPARRLAEKRCIPLDKLTDVYLCTSFYKFSNGQIKDKFPSLMGDHPRMLIPFRNEKGEVFAYQGRAFGTEQPKYITIKLDEKADKIYGLDRVDISKEIYVVEGPIDSMFLDNCIAVGDADLSKPLVIAGKSIANEQVTAVFDNEPRNRELCKLIKKTIDQGRKVVIWPSNIRHKDINDMIMSGMTKEEVQQIIIENSFSMAEAQLRFVKWRKTNA